MGEMGTFYQRIPPIRDFLQFGEPRHYGGDGGYALSAKELKTQMGAG